MPPHTRGVRGSQGLRALEAIEPQLRPHGLERAKIVGRDRYEVEANWKTVIENNRECYHCRVSYPEFCMSNYDLGLPGDARGDEDYDAALAREYERWRDLGLAPREVSFPDGAPFRVDGELGQAVRALVPGSVERGRFCGVS